MYPFAIFISLPVLGKKEGREEKDDAAPSPDSGEKSCREEIYRHIIERYSGLIEEHEAKSISEIKGLVSPGDSKVREICEGIKENYGEYSHERDFFGAAQDAVEFVSRIRTVSLPVNFWLSFSEIIELQAADQMDKGILLCSILRSLGSPDALVFLSEAREVYVLWGHEGRSHLFDAKENKLEQGSREEMKNKMGGNLLYSFNDREYMDLSEVKISD